MATIAKKNPDDRKKIGAVLAGEDVKVCPDCLEKKRFSQTCSTCKGAGFVNSDGSCLTKEKIEFLGRVAMNIDEIPKPGQQKTIQ